MCVRDTSYACVYTRRLGTPTASQYFFDLEKLSQILCVLRTGFEPQASPFQAFMRTRARNALVPAHSDLQLLPSGIAFPSPSKLILCPRLPSVSWRHNFSKSFRLIPTPTHPLPGSPWWPSTEFFLFSFFSPKLVIDLFYLLIFIPPPTLRHEHAVIGALLAQYKWTVIIIIIIFGSRVWRSSQLSHPAPSLNRQYHYQTNLNIPAMLWTWADCLFCSLLLIRSD